ncbi:hypothetical protein ACFL49_00945 [Candidatus Omnitrophota bacterium]
MNDICLSGNWLLAYGYACLPAGRELRVSIRLPIQILKELENIYNR